MAAHPHRPHLRSGVRLGRLPNNSRERPLANRRQHGRSICTAVASGVGGGSYCPSGSGASSSATVVATSLNGIWTSGATAAQSISAAGGTFGVALMFAGLLVLVLTGLFIVEAMFMVVMGKLALFVLLGLAPIFIALALFNVSSMLFTGWIRSCLTFSIVPLLTYGFLGFFEGLITGQMSSLNAAASGQAAFSVGTVAPFVALCAMGALLMTTPRSPRSPRDSPAAPRSDTPPQSASPRAS